MTQFVTQDIMLKIFYFLFILKVNCDQQECVADTRWVHQVGYINSTNLGTVTKATTSTCVDRCRTDIDSDVVFYDGITQQCYCFNNIRTPSYYTMAYEHYTKLNTIITKRATSRYFL